MRDGAEDRARRKNALKLLAVHRQAKPDQETAAAYLVALQDVPADVLEQACNYIGFTARGEHELAWPDLGTIRSRCEAILRYRREQRDSRRLLEDKRPAISPERLASILEQCRAMSKTKAMK